MDNTVDIKVGSLIRRWVVTTTGSEYIRLDKRTNLWAIVKQNLDILPADFREVADRSEYISIELLNTTSHRNYNVVTESLIYTNPFFRCYISETGQAAIRRYLENQLRAAFRMFMTARIDADETIDYAITSFLLEFDLPVDKKILARLRKDWYRYREKTDDKFRIPIFF